MQLCTSERVNDVPGYLEFMWLGDRENPEHDQVAMIADNPHEPGTFCGSHGDFIVTASTVHEVKEQLLKSMECQ